MNIKKLNRIIEEEVKRPDHFGDVSYADIKERIENRIPAEWFDIWESAWNEIERLVSDGIWNAKRGVIS